MARGCVELNSVIDRELTGDVIYLTLQVRDMGMPQLSLSVNITYNVIELNDENPAFDRDSPTSFLVREDFPIRSILHVYTAQDPDKFPYLTYLLEPQGIPFAVASDNGTVYLRSGLDYEATQNYTLLIRVNDMGSQTGVQSDSLIIRVHIQDANDNCPAFTNLPLSSPLEVCQSNSNFSLTYLVLSIFLILGLREHPRLHECVPRDGS